jgi:hypothetical protein
MKRCYRSTHCHKHRHERSGKNAVTIIDSYRYPDVKSVIGIFVTLPHSCIEEGRMQDRVKDEGTWGATTKRPDLTRWLKALQPGDS